MSINSGEAVKFLAGAYGIVVPAGGPLDVGVGCKAIAASEW